MPRKSVEQGIGEVIKDLFKAYHIDDKVYAIRIGDVWEEVMGKTVARYTTGIRERCTPHPDRLCAFAAGVVFSPG